MITDIALDTDGEILLDNKDDFRILHEKETVLQNIRTRILTPVKGLFYSPEFGSGLLQHIQTNTQKQDILLLEESIILALKSDPEVNSNTISLESEFFNETLTINMEFLLVFNKEKVNMNLSLDRNNITID